MVQIQSLAVLVENTAKTDRLEKIIHRAKSPDAYRDSLERFYYEINRLDFFA